MYAVSVELNCTVHSLSLPLTRTTCVVLHPRRPQALLKQLLVGREGSPARLPGSREQADRVVEAVRQLAAARPREQRRGSGGGRDGDGGRDIRLHTSEVGCCGVVVFVGGGLTQHSTGDFNCWGRETS